MNHARKYNLPNDETEQNRLDLMHHLMLQLLGGKLYTAPLPEKVDRVLGTYLDQGREDRFSGA